MTINDLIAAAVTELMATARFGDTRESLFAADVDEQVLLQQSMRAANLVTVLQVDGEPSREDCATLAEEVLTHYELETEQSLPADPLYVTVGLIGGYEPQIGGDTNVSPGDLIAWALMVTAYLCPRVDDTQTGAEVLARVVRMLNA